MISSFTATKRQQMQVGRLGLAAAENDLGRVGPVTAAGWQSLVLAIKQITLPDDKKTELPK